MPKRVRKKIGRRKKSHKMKVEKLLQESRSYKIRGKSLTPTITIKQEEAHLVDNDEKIEIAETEDVDQTPFFSHNVTMTVQGLTPEKLLIVSCGSTMKVEALQNVPKADYGQQQVEIPVLSCNQSSIVSAIKSEDECGDFSKMKQIFNLVKASISIAWLALHVQEGIHLLQLTASDNCKIVKSVFCFNSGIITIYVHHLPLPRSHSLWAGSERVPLLLEEGALEEVANIILEISVKADMRICPGNFETTYAHLWHGQRYGKLGAIETFSVEPSFRVFNCDLLTQKSKCTSCMMFKHALQSIHSREAKFNSQPKGDPTARNNCRANSTLQVEGLKEKLAKASAKTKQLRSK